MRFDTTNPQYQRAIQIMGRYSPRQKAIFSTALADRHFAATDMGKKIKALAYGTDKKLDRRRLNIGEKAFKRDKKLNRVAEMLGVGNVILSGYMGSQNLENKIKIAKILGRR